MSAVESAGLRDEASLSIPMGGGAAGLQTSAVYERGLFLVEDLRDRIASALFRVASYLTEPVCKSHELYRRLCLVNSYNRSDGKIALLARKILLTAGIVLCGSVGAVAAVPAIALRMLAAAIQKHPYLHFASGQKEKGLSADRSFSLLSWNVCCVAGGYAISDGGVMPWAFRIDRVIHKIVEKSADVVCLYEIFDLEAGWTIAERLKSHGYSHFYFNFGAQGIGASSGIFVASKYKIQNPDFTPFPKEILVGRTKYCAKGVFGFDLESGGKTFARIFATHLQHSEEPQFPTEEEVDARKKQMELIAQKVDAASGAVIVTGDLNLDDREYAQSSWKDRFEKRDEFIEKTWGGDQFCADLVGKQGSEALNLDHTMIVKGSVKEFRTSIVETGFDGKVFNEEALSDHSGLYSRIAVW